MYEGRRSAITNVTCYYWAWALALWQRVSFYQPIGDWFWNFHRNLGADWLQRKSEQKCFNWIFCNFKQIRFYNNKDSRSQWPRGLRRRSAAARLLRSWVRIPPGAWIFVCCGSCVLSGRGLCDELITRPEESYRLWWVVICDLENLKNEEAMTSVGSQRHLKKKTFL
jgi:hypothetical protein